jgi:hypothetical protein
MWLVENCFVYKQAICSLGLTGALSSPLTAVKENNFQPTDISILAESLRILSRVIIAEGDGQRPPLTKFAILLFHYHSYPHFLERTQNFLPEKLSDEESIKKSSDMGFLQDYQGD